MNHSFKKYFLITVLVLCGFNTTTWAVEAIQIDRYLKTNEQPTQGQSNLLDQPIYIHFPASVKTVGNALDELLKPTGYQLVKNHLPDAMNYMLQRPLPKVQHELGPLTLQQTLQVLSGNTFQLAVDPVHRLITFKPKNIYSGDYQLNAVHS